MKKRISIYFLILALLLSMGLFLTQKFNANNGVQAEETPYFVMEEGTTYRSRWIEAQCGITYTAKISKKKLTEFKTENGTANNSVKLFIIPYEYVTGILSSTNSKFDSAKELVKEGKYLEGFEESKKYTSFWYGIVDNIWAVENEKNSDEYLLIGGLKGIQTSNMNRRYFGIYYIEGEKGGEKIREYAEMPSKSEDSAEITKTEKAGRTSNSMAYMVSYLSATKETSSLNDWEIERLNTFLDKSIKGALGSVLQINGTEIDSTLSNGYEFGVNYADGVNVIMGTVSEVVTESNVKTLSGDVTYGDDAFLYDVYLKYLKDGESKLQKITSSLDFYFKWTVQDTDYLKQNEAYSRKNVEVQKIGDNKTANVKVGFETKTVHFNTKKFIGEVDFLVEDLAVDRSNEYYSATSNVALPKKATVTLKNNRLTKIIPYANLSTTRYNDKIIEYTFGGASCTNENGNFVTTYNLKDVANGTIKTNISVAEFNKNLNVASSEFDRSLGQANVNADLSVDADLYSFTGSYDKFNVKLNKYNVIYSPEYEDLTGDGDKVAISAESSVKEYYFTDENVNLNQGESDGITVTANGYTFNGFNVDTAFDDNFFSSDNLNKNYSLFRGSFHNGYFENQTAYNTRNRILLYYKVKVGTKIKINTFNVNHNGSDKKIKLGIIQSDALTVKNCKYNYDSLWLSSSGQQTLPTGDANADCYVLNNPSNPSEGGVYTIKGHLYEGGNNVIDEAQTKRKDFDYVYIIINVAIDSDGELSDTSFAQAVINQNVFEINGSYSKTVNTQATAIDNVSLVGSYYTAQGSYEKTTNNNTRMRIVFTRKIKVGTVISWNTNKTTSYNNSNGYKFGFIEATTSSYNEATSYFSDSKWTTASDRWGYTGTVEKGAYTVVGNKMNLKNGGSLEQQEYVYLIINIARIDDAGPIGEECNDIEAVLALFTFDGYFEQTDSTLKNSLLEFTMPSRNVYLYGMLKANYYNVQYDYADGSSGSTVVKFKVRYGKKFKADNIPTKDGYLFSGWVVSVPEGQKISENAKYVGFKYNSSNVASPIGVQRKILSSQMICNNKWGEAVTLKSLTDTAETTVTLTACWTKNVNDSGETGFYNNSKGYVLNGTYGYDWAVNEDNNTQVHFNFRTELSRKKFGNFKKVIKLYQEAGIVYKDTEKTSNFNDISWRTAILGFYRYNWNLVSEEEAKKYYRTNTFLRLDNKHFNGQNSMISLEDVTTVEMSDEGFFNGTKTASTGNSLFYEVIKYSYVTFTVTAENVASYKGDLKVKVDIQSVNPEYMGTTYSITYLVNNLDLYAIDLHICGDYTNYAILEDTLEYTGENNQQQLLTYSKADGEIDGDIKNYTEYAPDLTLNTSMNSSEAYTMTIKQKANINSDVWNGNSSKGVLPVLYSKDSKDFVDGKPANYGYMRSDWWMESSDNNSANPYDYLRLVDYYSSYTDRSTDVEKLNILKDCTIQVTIQKVNQFIHVKMIIGDINAKGWTCDYYYVYVNRARDLANKKYASPLDKQNGNVDVNSVPISIMAVCNDATFSVIEPLHSVSVTDNISLGNQAVNTTSGWTNNDVKGNSYFTKLADNNGNFSKSYYIYMNGCLTDTENVWEVPLTILNKGSDVNGNNCTAFRFDNLTENKGYFGAWKETEGFTETYNASKSFTTTGEKFSETTNKLIKDSIVKITVSRTGNNYKLELLGFYAFNTAELMSFDTENSVNSFKVIREFTSSYTGVVGIGISCEWSQYRVINGIS